MPARSIPVVYASSTQNKHPHTITHSGRSFTSLGFEGGRYRWPLDEFLARHPELDESEIAMLVQFNPNGQLEGDYPKGFMDART